MIAGLGIVAGAVISVATFGVASPVGALVAGAAITTGATMTYAAATDQAMVIDVSVTAPIKETGYVKVGTSVIIDFGENAAYAYGHAGAGYGYGSGASYSVGLVSNYTKADDYAGSFVDVNAGNNVGIDHCWAPGKPYDTTTKATAVTFSTGKSYGVGYDRYTKPIKLLAW